MLKEKANNNYNVAVYAEENEYFDAAVSRYYYYLFQNIIDYMNNIPIILSGNYNHDTRIWSLVKHLKEKNRDEFEHNREILKLQGLKTQRHHSDYFEDKIINTKIQFEKKFKNDFLKVENALKVLSVME